MENRPCLRSQACGAGIPKTEAEGRLLLPHPLWASVIQVSLCFPWLEVRLPQTTMFPVVFLAFKTLGLYLRGQESISGPVNCVKVKLVSRQLATPPTQQFLTAGMCVAVGMASRGAGTGWGAARSGSQGSAFLLEGVGHPVATWSPVWCCCVLEETGEQDWWSPSSL